MKKNKEKNVATNEDTNVVKNKKKKGVIAGIIVLILAVIITAAGLLYAFVFSIKTIDLSECLKIEYSGYDGYATATVNIDQDKLKEKVKDSKTAKNFVKKAELDVKNKNELSNGDEIEVKISISDSFLEQNKIKLKEEKIKISVTGLEQFSAIDLSKYIKLSYTGFNKYATAKAEIDESLKEVIGNDIYKEFVRQVSLSILNNENLENGKDVEVKVSISSSWLRENGIELKSDTPKVAVSGLQDAKEFDAFKDMKVNISGMSPNLNLSITNESTDEFLKTVKYTVNKTSGISNGEIIKITVSSWDKEMAEKKGYVLTELTTDYKVENQAAYVSTKSEITDKIKAQIKSSFIEKAKSKGNDSKYEVHFYTDHKYVNTDDYAKDLTVGEPEIVSLYLLTKKADRTTSAANKVIGIVRVPFVSASTGSTYNWFITVSAKNFSINKDGTISDNAVYDIYNNNAEDEEKAYNAYVNREKNDFDVQSIPLN